MKKFLLFLLCAWSLAACEKSIKVTLPADPAKLVMNAVVRVGDPIVISLSRSRSIKETNQQIPAGIAGALVVLYVDGQVADTLHALTSSDTSTYATRIIAQPGKTYRLYAAAKGYESIEATATAPTNVPITSWDFKPNARQSTYGGSDDALNIGFTDPGGSRDFYVMLIAEAYDAGTEMDFYSYASCAYTSDPSVETAASSDPLSSDECISSNSIFLRDVLFNGADKKLGLYLPAGSLNPQIDTAGNKQYANIYLYHVSEEFYKYLKSYRASQDANGNPFSEPINVSTNVQGGYGIFAIVNLYKEEIGL